MTYSSKSHPGATCLDLGNGRSFCLAEEVPIALTFNGVTQAVMMASPMDIEDFLIGFAMTEGLVERPADIESLEVIAHPDGYEAQAWLSQHSGAQFTERRRAILGPIGCGLCGIDSLEQAMRPLPAVAFDKTVRISATAPMRAMDAMRAQQALHAETRATHAAGFWTEESGIVCLREDVGRHNAFDKLAGALLRQGADIGRGAIVMTSRLSVDLVQKAAMIGAPIIVAPSAPTALAVRQAEKSGITLIARQGDRPGAYTHPGRLETAR